MPDDTRAVRGWPWLDGGVRDLRLAARGLRRHPGYAAAAVLTLVLGIGATTTVFSIVNGVLLRPLPYPRADAIVRLFQHRTSDRAPGTAFRSSTFTRDQIEGWRARTRTLSHLAMFQTRAVTVTGPAVPARVWGSVVSPELFEVMGTPPVLGRAFRPEDAAPGRDAVVILSHRVWAGRFGSDADLIDTVITIDERDHRVVGVMPPGFDYPGVMPSYRPGSGRREGGTELWLPVTGAAPPNDSTPGPTVPAFGSVVARLAPGVTLEQALAEAQVILPALPDSEGARPELAPLHEEIVGSVRPALRLLIAAVCLVLAIAVANVVSLTLARAESRQRELEVRRALGAGPAALVRHALAESLLVALLGGLGGWGLAVAAIRTVGSLGFGTLPRLAEVRADLDVLLFTVGVAGGCALTCGLAPVWRARSLTAATAPRPSRPPVSHPRSTRGLRAIVVAEVALASALVVAAALLGTSFLTLVRVEPGFDPDGVLTFSVPLPEARYPTTPPRQDVARQLTAAFERLPGGEGVALSNSLPFQFLATVNGIAVDGDLASPPRVAALRIVAPGYFETLRVPMRRGRAFDDGDQPGGPPVAIVSEAFVQRHLAGRDPLTVELGLGPAVTARIVGVAASARHQLQGDPFPELFLPYAQLPNQFRGMMPGLTFGLRVTPAPDAVVPMVRQAVASVDAGLAIDDVAMLDRRVADSIGSTRFYAVAIAAFSTVAALLAVFGIYGVLVYSVNRRIPEIGIRIALGATPRTIGRLVTGQGLAMAGTGLVIGIAAAVALTGSLQSLLWGTSPRDPVIFGGVALAFILIAWMACALPAARASRISPVDALRWD